MTFKYKVVVVTGDAAVAPLGTPYTYLIAPMPFRIPAMPVAATSLNIFPSSSNV